MKISPRYDTEPIVRLDGPPAAVGAPMLRQRRRFAEVLSALSPEQWASPSRCEGWTVQDVVSHLAGTDLFWNVSFTSGLAGTPTRMLVDFDPKETPAQLVDARRGASPEDTLASFLHASEALCATVESLDDDGWMALGEAPLGHLPLSALAHHALWDAWIHERDVLLPLGMTQQEEPDEIVASLRYVAALSPAFALQSASPSGALVLDVTRPDARVVVRVDDCVCVEDGDAPDGAVVLAGDAVELLEALSVRAPLSQPIPPEQAWFVTGLSEAFA